MEMNNSYPTQYEYIGVPLNVTYTSWCLHIKNFHQIPQEDYENLWWLTLYHSNKACHTSKNFRLLRDTTIVKDVMPKIVAFQRQIAHNEGSYYSVQVNCYDGLKGHYSKHHAERVDDIIRYSNIWILSYGCPRTYEFKSKFDNSITQIVIENGDALIMGGETQDTHTYSMIKPLNVVQSGKHLNLMFKQLWPSIE